MTATRINPPLVTIDAVWQPLSQQKIYRALLAAMSFPGRVEDIAEPLDGARAELGILAALTDEMVTVADPDGRLTEAERRLLSVAALAPAESADYVLFSGRNAPNTGYTPRIGTIYRPEEAALLIIVCENVGEGELLLTLSGPGVATESRLRLAGVDAGWIAARNRWCGNFPTGVDIVFCDGARLAAIPRTSRVVMGGE